MSKVFNTIACLLGAIKACEGNTFSMALVSEKCLRCSEKERDILAVKLQKAGYIEGLYIVDGTDDHLYPVILWEQSKPYITIAGMAFIAENKPLRKAIDELKDIAVAIAAAKLTNTLFTL